MLHVDVTPSPSVPAASGTFTPPSHVLWGERLTAGPPYASKETRMASNPVFDRIEKDSRQGYAGFGRGGG